MTPIRIVFSTTDSFESAREIARQLVQQNLAACVTILSRVTSIYKWKGAQEETDEWLLVIKTSDQRVAELQERLAQLHPYEVPEIISFAIDKAHGPYLDWILENTTGGAVRESDQGSR